MPQGKQELATDPLACLLPKAGASLFFTWGKGSGVSEGQAARVARCFARPLRWRFVQEAHSVPCSCCQHPVFAPGSSKVGSWVVWSLCIFWVQNLPQLHLRTVIFSPMQFLCILLLKERCVQPESQVLDLSFFI